MKYLKIDTSLYSKEPIEYFIYQNKKYAIDGYDAKKSFIYGKGYVSVGKRMLAQPLPENYTSTDIINAYNEYGEHVMMKLISPRYNPNDCTYSGYCYEVSNIIEYGLSYDAFLSLAYSIDESCISILSERYGVCIKYNDFYIGDDIIPAYYENVVTGRLHTTNRQAHYFSGNIDLSLMGMMHMDAHYNSISHEINLKSIIRRLSTIYPILNRTYQLDSIEDSNKLSDKLSNMSVSDMILHLYGEKVRDNAILLNSYKLGSDLNDIDNLFDKKFFNK